MALTTSRKGVVRGRPLVGDGDSWAPHEPTGDRSDRWGMLVFSYPMLRTRWPYRTVSEWGIVHHMTQAGQAFAEHLVVDGARRGLFGDRVFTPEYVPAGDDQVWPRPGAATWLRSWPCHIAHPRTSVSGTKTCNEFMAHAWRTTDASCDSSRSTQRGGHSDGCIRYRKPAHGS